MATNNTTTVYNSIRLAAGETFTLPPGAELIATEQGESSITSTCPIPPLENLGCYVALFGTPSPAQQGGDTIYFGTGNAKISGFRLNRVDQNFNTVYVNSGPDLQFLSTDLDPLGVELKTKVPAIFDSANSFTLSNRNDNGTLSYFLIKTVPSIANNLEMIYTTSIPSDGNNFGTTYYVKFVPLADIIAAGYVGYPSCP